MDPIAFNRDLVIRALNAFHESDQLTLHQVWSPDLVWHMAGTSPISGDYFGRNAFLAFGQRLLDDSDGTFYAEMDDVTASEHHAVLLSRATAVRRNRTLDVRETLVFRVVEGQLAECWDSKFDQEHWDEFWS